MHHTCQLTTGAKTHCKYLTITILKVIYIYIYNRLKKIEIKTKHCDIREIKITF